MNEANVAVDVSAPSGGGIHSICYRIVPGGITWCGRYGWPAGEVAFYAVPVGTPYVLLPVIKAVSVFDCPNVIVD